MDAANARSSGDRWESFHEIRALPPRYQRLMFLSLVHDSDPFVRSDALDELLHVCRPTDWRAFYSATFDAHWIVRVSGVGGLEDFPTRTVRKRVLELFLHDPEPIVRGWAAGSLCHMPNREENIAILKERLEKEKSNYVIVFISLELDQLGMGEEYRLRALTYVDDDGDAGGLIRDRRDRWIKEGSLPRPESA
jgi:hypothetical protein